MAKAASLTKAAIMQRLTRIQGPEQEQTVAFNPLTTLLLPSSLKTDKFIWMILVRFHGRVTNGGTVYTALSNALWNLIQEFRVKGTHSKYGAQVIYKMRGAAVRDLAQIFGRAGYTPGVYSFVAGTATPFAGTASTSFDVDVMWPLFLAPQNIPLADQILYGAVKGPDWAGDLHLEMDAADGTALGSATAGNVTFSAYGSGSGTPTMYVSLVRVVMGVNLMNAVSPAITFKSYRDLSGILQAASLVGQKISDLNIGKGTVRSILRTGTLKTGTSAGVSVMSSLSDSIITRAFPSLDGKPIKNPYSNLDTKEIQNYCLGVQQLTGYNILDFVEGGNIHSMMRSQNLTSARRFEVDGDITAAANQGGEEIQEEILGAPAIAAIGAASSTQPATSASS